MPEYRVMWEIDITADTPEEAAAKAREMQMDPTAMSNFYDVMDSGTEEEKQIELTEYPIRKSLMWFARHMEEKLRKHDHDRGEEGWLQWPDGDPNFDNLWGELSKEILEMHMALTQSVSVFQERGEVENAQAKLSVIKECADAANILMMIADNVRRLIEKGNK